MAVKVSVLGSTGSIGRSTLDVIRDFPDAFDVVALSTFDRTDLLERQIREFEPEAVCVANGEKAKASSFEFPLNGVDLLGGDAGLVQMVEGYEADVLVVATVGFAGLFPTMAGIENGVRIALANKEVLVVGGDMVMRRAREKGVPVLPVDSEHNAVFQCLAGQDPSYLRRIVLTASGGPFLKTPADVVDGATPDMALKHPTWDMGAKISVDSASLMNKGFEVIEACHLFGVGPEQVDVVVHPQSVVHSMVEYADRSILAQLGPTNMYLPILNVLTWPERLENKFEPLDLARMGKLTFMAPDRKRFPCLNYAYEAIQAGGTLPAWLNGANEVAVGRFLDRQIAFGDIARCIRHVMDSHVEGDAQDLVGLREADRLSREKAEAYFGKLY